MSEATLDIRMTFRAIFYITLNLVIYSNVVDLHKITNNFLLRNVDSFAKIDYLC